MSALRMRGLGRIFVCLVLLSQPLWIQGLKPRPKAISDDLRDVVDDEEDEEWKEWGRQKKPPVQYEEQEAFEINNGPIDVSKLMKKQASGPQLCFARLRPDATRTEEDTKEIGDKWAALLKTGGMSDQIYPVDDGTLLISLTDGEHMDEIRDFVLSRDEAYEFEWKQQKWRRPGDPELPPKNTERPETKEKKPKTSKKNKKKKNKTKMDQEEL